MKAVVSLSFSLHLSIFIFCFTLHENLNLVTIERASHRVKDVVLEVGRKHVH